MTVCWIWLQSEGGAQQQRQPAAPSGSSLPGSWPTPAANLLPGPALGLVSSMLTLPGLLLGSFLEANEFPDLASLARTSSAVETPVPSTSGSALAVTGEQPHLLATLPDKQRTNLHAFFMHSCMPKW